MTFNEETNEYTLSSGRVFYAYGSTIGVGVDISGDTAEYGCDGSIYMGDWTQAERQELADTMIARWVQWATTPPGL
jgi:hypothetical protein